MLQIMNVDFVQLGSAAASVIVVFRFLDYMAKSDDRRAAADEAKAEADKRLREAIAENTAVTRETIEFMRRLNGSLPKAVAEKQEIASKQDDAH